MHWKFDYINSVTDPRKICLSVCGKSISHLVCDTVCNNHPGPIALKITQTSLLFWALVLEIAHFPPSHFICQPSWEGHMSAILRGSLARFISYFVRHSVFIPGHIIVNCLIIWFTFLTPIRQQKHIIQYSFTKSVNEMYSFY